MDVRYQSLGVSSETTAKSSWRVSIIHITTSRSDVRYQSLLKNLSLSVDFRNYFHFFLDGWKLVCIFASERAKDYGYSTTHDQQNWPRNQNLLLWRRLTILRSVLVLPSRWRLAYLATIVLRRFLLCLILFVSIVVQIAAMVQEERSIDQVTLVSKETRRWASPLATTTQ